MEFSHSDTHWWSMAAYEMESRVRSYQDIWAAMIEENLYAKENHSMM